MSTIQRISAEKVLGFRGQETIEVTVFDEQGLSGEFRVPFGKSEGMFEAAYLAPDKAVEICNGKIAALLNGCNPQNQHEIDQKMIDADGTPQRQNLGGNSMLGVSVACARLAAHQQEIPLYQHLTNLFGTSVNTQRLFPRILYNLVEGGVHAQNNLVFQEHLIIPTVNSLVEQINTLKSFSAAFLQEVEKRGWDEIYGYEGGWAGHAKISNENLGGQAQDIHTEYELMKVLDSVRQQQGFAVQFGFDVAANNIKNFAPQAYYDTYVRLTKEFPLIYLEDGFHEQGQDDWWHTLYQQIHATTLVVGDDLTVTNPRKMQEYIGKDMINGMIIKPDQVGTLTETFEAIRKAKEQHWKVAVSHRSQETTDDYLADLAVAVQADFVKFGAFTQGERLAKYNRLLEIEK